MIAEAHWDQSSPRLLQGKRSVPGGRTVFFADSEPFVGASPGVDGGFPLADRIPKAASEGSKDQRCKFERCRCRNRLLLILSERD
jgi:hypothetical protein